MKYNSTTLSFCTANCCSWFYHLPVWYSYKLLCNFWRELVCTVAYYSLWYTAQSWGTWSGLPPIWVTADSSWKTWLLPGAARGWLRLLAIHKSSPHGITKRKRRTASYSWSVLLSYKLICMWAFSSPLIPITISTQRTRSQKVTVDRVLIYYLTSRNLFQLKTKVRYRDWQRRTSLLQIAVVVSDIGWKSVNKVCFGKNCRGRSFRLFRYFSSKHILANCFGIGKQNENYIPVV